MTRHVVRIVALWMTCGLLLSGAVPAVFAQQYTASPGDILNISVLGEPEVSGPVTVSPTGTISLQLVGELQVGGLTLPEITEKVTTALKAYVKEPQVVVTIKQAADKKDFVYLLGQVSKPGAYVMQESWTVAELVAVAGGPTPGANLPKAMILRKNTTIPVDLQQLLVEGNASANVPLQTGDVVIVPESKNKVVVMGAVAKPGPYLFKQGDKVVDVLSAAGGPAPKAVLNNIGVVRREGDKPIVKPVNLDKFYKDGDDKQNVVLEPGDVVYVPEKKSFDWGTMLGGLNNLAYLLLLIK
jgi:polysaccharide biosynthesis/export protein